MASNDRLRRVSGSFLARTIVVVGDVICDEYLIGKPARVSREAPVIILKFTDRDVRLGGAANAANNVHALGARVIPVGVVGADQAGDEVLGLFRAGGIGDFHRGIAGVHRNVPAAGPGRFAFLPARGGIIGEVAIVVGIDQETGPLAFRLIEDDEKRGRRFPRAELEFGKERSLEIGRGFLERFGPRRGQLEALRIGHAELLLQLGRDPLEVHFLDGGSGGRRGGVDRREGGRKHSGPDGHGKTGDLKCGILHERKATGNDDGR